MFLGYGGGRAVALRTARRKGEGEGRGRESREGRASQLGKRQVLEGMAVRMSREAESQTPPTSPTPIPKEAGVGALLLVWTEGRGKEPPNETEFPTGPLEKLRQT